MAVFKPGSILISLLCLISIATAQKPLDVGCQKDSDCLSGCCGFYGGKCVRAIIHGNIYSDCGRGGSAPHPVSPKKLAARIPEPPQSSVIAQYVQETIAPKPGPGNKYITEDCKSDAECQTRCCGFSGDSAGKCVGAITAFQMTGGCGFGDRKANMDAIEEYKKAHGLTGIAAVPAPSPTATAIA